MASWHMNQDGLGSDKGFNQDSGLRGQDSLPVLTKGVGFTGLLLRNLN